MSSNLPTAAADTLPLSNSDAAAPSALTSAAPSSTPYKEARVGVGVLLVKQGTTHILAGRRKSRLGTGDWALPGGHLDYGETFEECAAREVLEETGIVINSSDITFAYAVNTVFPHGAHYVTIFMKAVVPFDTTAQNMEPDKCDGWEWFELAQVPKPVFLPLQKLIDTGFKIEPSP